MQRALELAKRGLGKTHPNPAVGCVILKDGEVGQFEKLMRHHCTVFIERHSRSTLGRKTARYCSK